MQVNLPSKEKIVIHSYVKNWRGRENQTDRHPTAHNRDQMMLFTEDIFNPQGL